MKNPDMDIYSSKRSIHYRKYILQITQPSQYRYTQLQYRFAVISEAPSTYMGRTWPFYLMVAQNTMCACEL